MEDYVLIRIKLPKYLYDFIVHYLQRYGRSVNEEEISNIIVKLIEPYYQLIYCTFVNPKEYRGRVRITRENFNKIIDDVLNHLKLSKGYSDNTIRDIRRVVESFFRRYFESNEEFNLDDNVETKINEYLEYLKSSQTSEGSRKKYRYCLTKFFNALREIY